LLCTDFYNIFNNMYEEIYYKKEKNNSYEITYHIDLVYKFYYSQKFLFSTATS